MDCNKGLHPGNPVSGPTTTTNSFSKKVSSGVEEASAPATTPRRPKPVIVDQLPFDSSNQEEWGPMQEKPGCTSPSTVSVTSFSSDADLPTLPLYDDAMTWNWRGTESSDDNNSNSDHSHLVSLHHHHHASVIQAAVRQLLTRTVVPSKWAKQRENEKNRKIVAATSIQAFFRSWRARMLVLIDKMGKKLEQTQRLTDYALHSAEWIKHHDMKQIKRRMEAGKDIDLYFTERDLSATLKLVEDLRAENKKLRLSNQSLMKGAVTQQKKNRKLRADKTSLAKKTALVSARLPRLERENKTLVESDHGLRNRTREYQDSVHEVKEFLELEMKTAIGTKETITKILTVVKELCVDETVANTITGMGTGKLERNEEYVRYLKKEARRKIAKDEEIVETVLTGASAPPEGAAAVKSPPKKKMQKKPPPSDPVKSQLTARGDQPAKSSACEVKQVPVKKCVSPQNNKNPALLVQKGISTAMEKVSPDGVKQVPAKKPLDRAQSVNQIGKTLKNSPIAFSTRKPNPPIQRTPSVIATRSSPMKKRLPQDAPEGARSGATTQKLLQKNYQGTGKRRTLEIQTKISEKTRLDGQKTALVNKSRPLGVQRLPMKKRAPLRRSKSMVVKRTKQAFDQTVHLPGKGSAETAEKPVKIAIV